MTQQQNNNIKDSLLQLSRTDGNTSRAMTEQELTKPWALNQTLETLQKKHNSCFLAIEEQIVPKLPRYF